MSLVSLVAATLTQQAVMLFVQTVNAVELNGVLVESF